MKIKRLIGLAIAVVAMVMLATPVLAGSIEIQGIYQYPNAAENEPALVVVWTGRPPFEVKAGEFYLQKKETTVAEVEARIMEKFNDLLVEDTKLTTLEADDPVRQDPPILLPDEEIVIINNNEYLRYHRAYFKIHIYSLDNLSTPQSELNFACRFSKDPIGDNWWPAP